MDFNSHPLAAHLNIAVDPASAPGNFDESSKRMGFPRTGIPLYPPHGGSIGDFDFVKQIVRSLKDCASPSRKQFGSFETVRSVSKQINHTQRKNPVDVVSVGHDVGFIARHSNQTRAK